MKKSKTKKSYNNKKLKSKRDKYNEHVDYIKLNTIDKQLIYRNVGIY